MDTITDIPVCKAISSHIYNDTYSDYIVCTYTGIKKHICDDYIEALAYIKANRHIYANMYILGRPYIYTGISDYKRIYKDDI